MKEIEVLAIELFNKHALRIDGRTYDWNYLSRYRQIEWMKEVLINTTFILSKIRGKLKNPPVVLPGETVYGMGFKAGQKVQYHEYINVIEELHLDLANQLTQIMLEHKG